ncbi:hypothetical protein tb265_26510 [Gemmatimonadetes bacterium T265]|nr:hypothetical protein tb265_26510 [Gemmatimonadetes bacterium T265]
MKHLMPAVAAVGVGVFAVPAFAQSSCDSLARPRTAAYAAVGARHQVLAPRDASPAGTARLTTRRVRMADGSVRVQKSVTRSGVRVSKAKPGACPVVAAAPATTSDGAVGDVAPTPAPSAPAPVVAPGEVVAPILPTVGGRVGLPLLAGLLLGGTAIAVGSHTPTSSTTTPTAGSGTGAGGGTGTGGGTTGGGTTGGTGGGTGGTGGTGGGGGGTGGGGGAGTGGGGTGGGATGGGGTGGGGTGGGGTGGGGTGGGGTVVPEPTTVMLTLGGLVMLAGVARRRR